MMFRNGLRAEDTQPLQRLAPSPKQAKRVSAPLVPSKLVPVQASVVAAGKVRERLDLGVI